MEKIGIIGNASVGLSAQISKVIAEQNIVVADIETPYVLNNPRAELVMAETEKKQFKCKREASIPISGP